MCAGGGRRGGGRRRACGWRSGASHDGCRKQSRLSARAARCENDGKTDPNDRHGSRGDATDQPARGRGPLLLRPLRQGRLSLLSRVSRRWRRVAPRWRWLVAGGLAGVAWVTRWRGLVGGGCRRIARLRLLRISGRRCWAGRRCWVAGLRGRLISGRRSGGHLHGRGGHLCRCGVHLRRRGGRLDGLGSSAGGLRTCGPAASAESSVCAERRAAALAVILLRYPSAGIHAFPPWSRAFIRNELFEPECRTYSTFTAA